MNIEQSLLNIPSSTQDAQTVKDMILARLYNDGLMSEEDYNHYSNDWQVMVFKRSWFRKWCRKFTSDEQGDYQFKYVQFEDKPMTVVTKQQEQ